MDQIEAAGWDDRGQLPLIGAGLGACPGHHGGHPPNATCLHPGDRCVCPGNMVEQLQHFAIRVAARSKVWSTYCA